MLRTHNYTAHVTHSPTQPFFDTDYDNEERGQDPLIPKPAAEDEVVRTRRIYSGIHSSGNMTDEVVIEKIAERRISFGRGGAGNLRSFAPESCRLMSGCPWLTDSGGNNRPAFRRADCREDC